jgi:nitroreductase
MWLVVQSTDHLARNIGSVPVHPFVCGTEGRQETIYPATQNVVLACRGLGLGTVLTGFHRRWDDDIRELLGIPADQVPLALMPIGYPSDKIGPVNRRPVRKAASLDT